MANIQRIENKKGISYKIRVSCGYDAQGKKMVESTTFIPDPSVNAKQQEKDLQQFVMDFEKKVKNGTCFDGEKKSFEEFAHDWLLQIENNRSYSTYRGYEMMLRLRIVPYFKSYKVAKIKLPMVEAFYSTLVDDCAQASIKKYDMVLSSMFKTAMRWQMIEKNPCDGAIIPKSKKKTDGLKFFTPEQSQTFLDSLDMEFEMTYKGHKRIDDTGKTYYVGDYVERRGMAMQHKLFFHIAVFCGMRRSEILALYWDDIDFERKTVRITKSVARTKKSVDLKEPKTKTSIRTVPMPDCLIPLFKQYKTEYDELKVSLGDRWAGNGNIFIQADGKLMGMHTPYQRFVSHLEHYNKWVKQTNKNLPEGEKKLKQLPKIPFHGLRHAYVKHRQKIFLKKPSVHEHPMALEYLYSF